jgi:hypothetical protein
MYSMPRRDITMQCKSGFVAVIYKEELGRKEGSGVRKTVELSSSHHQEEA